MNGVINRPVDWYKWAYDHVMMCTYCAWKSTSTGRLLLMTRSVKSSWSWTLKETLLLCGRGRGSERVRNGCTAGDDVREEEYDEEDETVTGPRQKSLTDTEQTLRMRSLEAIWDHREKKQWDIHTTHLSWRKESLKHTSWKHHCAIFKAK